MRADAQIDQTFEIGRRRGFTFLQADRFIQKLQIEIVADGFHLAMLLRAEEISGAAQLEIAHGDLEAGTEFGKFADRGKALLGDFGEDFIACKREVGVGAARRTPDAAAQLVKLGKSHPVGVVDDQRIHVRNVDARFDDRRTDEQVDFMIEQPLPDRGKLVFVHPAVSGCDARLRDLLL